MSIAHELSCDVATAMLSERKDEQADGTRGGGDLTDIVLEVHTTLRQLTGEARRRRAQAFQAHAPQSAGNAASGNH